MALLRPQTFQPKLPEIGRLFKGSKKTPKAPGKDLDFFRFEPDQRTYEMPRSDGQEGTLAQQLIEAWSELGDKPRNVSIRFLYDSIDKVFPCSNEVWKDVGGRSRCTNRCNGQTQLIHLEKQNGKTVLSKQPIPCQAQEGQNECPLGCKPTARLLFMLPDLKYPGQIILTTHSINDIMNIQGNLGLWNNRDLSKIPFKLCRTKQNIRYEQGGQARDMDRWICHIEIDPSFGNQVLEAQPSQYLAQLQGAEPLALDAEVIEEPEPVVAKMDWSGIIKTLGFSRQLLVSIAQESGLPTSSKDLSQSQESELLDACLLNWTVGPEKDLGAPIFPHEKAAVNSLAKLRRETALDGLELANAWIKKIQSKVKAIQEAPAQAVKKEVAA